MTAHTQAEIFKFLKGEGPLEGVHFGEAHPSGQAFWWRKYLSVAAPSTSPITDARIEAAIDVWFEVGEPRHKDYKARMRAAIEAAIKGGE